jgi:hypothetical protein
MGYSLSAWSSVGTPLSLVEAALQPHPPDCEVALTRFAQGGSDELSLWE